MRHLKRTIKLGRTSSHRDAMLAGLVCNLINAKRITTTLPKAKAVRQVAEKMVTLAKKNTIAARRLAVARLHQQDSVKALFDSIAPEFKDRQGGYTRIVRLGRRSGDSSEMAILEWVNYIPRDRKERKKAAASKEAPAGEAAAADAAKPKRKAKAAKAAAKAE